MAPVESSRETAIESQRGSRGIKGVNSEDSTWLPILALLLMNSLKLGQLFRLFMPQSPKL